MTHKQAPYQPFKKVNKMIIHKTKPIAIHDWDWREQPDFARISSVANDFLERFEHGINIIPVNTGADEYAIVIGDKDLTCAMAKQAYDQRYDIEEGIDSELLDWPYAEKQLKEIRQQYVDIGSAGIPALNAVINPLLIRLEKGEQTKDLYDAIFNLQ